MYSRRDIGLMGFAAGLLTGMLVAFAACSPTPDPTYSPITQEYR
jgi:hypothetical protein